MNLRKYTLELTLFTLALILALFVRLFRLDAAPLSEAEATWAVQALQVARPAMEGTAAPIGPQPAYVMLTGLSFSLFGASTFLARFWPALVGAFLVLLPVFFRRDLGRSAALILAFGLAVDTGLVTASRQAGGPMLALSFGLLALGFWHVRKPLQAGLLGGLALLSGPAIITGMIGLGLAWVVARFASRFSSPESQEKQETAADESAGPVEDPSSLPSTTGGGTASNRVRTALLAAAGTIVLVSTMFLRYPQGLAAWFSSLPAYLESWLTPSGVSPLLLAAALLFFQTFVLTFALVGIGHWIFQRSRGSSRGVFPVLFPLLWACFSLLLALIYPARQMSDLVWMLVPLWALAAQELAYYLPEGKPNVISLLQAGLITILAILLWNTLIATNQIAPTSSLTLPGIRLAVFAGILVLGALTSLLVALGWSWDASRNGLVWGLTVALVVYQISVLWGAAQLRFNQPQELWSSQPSIGQADLLVNTLRDLSNWSTGFPHTISIDSTIDTPSLRWALRDYPGARFVQAVPQGEMPDVVITRQDQTAPTLTATYRGHDFIWWVSPGWSGALPPDIVRWVTFREAPLASEKIILWARSDLFSGAAKQKQTTP